MTPFAWASKSVLFCYSDSSITKQRFLGETVPDLILNRKKLVSKVKVAKILEEKNIILAERREGGQKRALICVCRIHTGNRIKIKDKSVREYSLDTTGDEALFQCTKPSGVPRGPSHLQFP